MNILRRLTLAGLAISLLATSQVQSAYGQDSSISPQVQKVLDKASSDIKKKKPEKAIKRYEDLLENEDLNSFENDAVSYRLAYYYLQQGNVEDSIPLYETVLNNELLTGQDLERSKWGLIKAYLQSDRVEDATKLASAHSDVTKLHASLLKQLGQAWEQKGDLEKAKYWTQHSEDKQACLDPRVKFNIISNAVSTQKIDKFEELINRCNPKSYNYRTYKEIYDKTRSGNSEAFPIYRMPARIPDGATSSGHCVVSFDVTEKGKIEKPSIKSCTDPIFGPSSLNAIQKFRYFPALKNNIPVRANGQTQKFTAQVSR